MNAHYQYFLATGDSANLATAIDSSRTQSPLINNLRGSVVPNSAPSSNPVSEPVTPTTPTIPTNPIVDNTATVDDTTRTSTASTTQGGSSINVFGSGLNGAYTTNALILPISTAVTTDGEGNPIIAGGGGGGIMPSEEGGAENILPFGKTIIPLVVMAVGAAILILKPIK